MSSENGSADSIVIELENEFPVSPLLIARRAMPYFLLLAGFVAWGAISGGNVYGGWLVRAVHGNFKIIYYLLLGLFLFKGIKALIELQSVSYFVRDDKLFIVTGWLKKTAYDFRLHHAIKITQFSGALDKLLGLTNVRFQTVREVEEPCGEIPCLKSLTARLLVLRIKMLTDEVMRRESAEKEKRKTVH